MMDENLPLLRVYHLLLSTFWWLRLAITFSLCWSSNRQTGACEAV